MKYYLLLFIPILFACSSEEKKKPVKPFVYKEFKDSILNERSSDQEGNNLFDTGLFIPANDSVENLLVSVDTILSRLKRIDQLPEEEKLAVRENLQSLDSFFKNRGNQPDTLCKEKECPLFARIDKSRQLLFLYLDGELKDSFKVSTGKKKYTTPNMSVRPRGPAFTKYTSRKFPGGNYKGLGNMPYAVFVKGGYAIHGTTPGNFSKLGTVASHGCIRLHPDNARVFYELTKIYGLKNTWVEVSDTLR